MVSNTCHGWKYIKINGSYHVAVQHEQDNSCSKDNIKCEALPIKGKFNVLVYNNWCFNLVFISWCRHCDAGSCKYRGK